jgi:hypothetical protein
VEKEEARHLCRASLLQPYCNTLGQGVFDNANRRFLHGRQHVRIGVRRLGDVSVPQHLLDYLRVDVLAEQ